MQVEAAKGNGDKSLEDKNQALILFDTALMQRMQTTQRLPGTYIGVRKIRPSSREVHRAHVAKIQGFKAPPMPPIAFKVVDPQTGEERRMTGAEKKAAKLERARLHRIQVQQAKSQRMQNKEAKEIDEPNEETKNENDKEDEDLAASLETRVNEATTKSEEEEEEAETNQDRFYYFKMSRASLEQELADLSGDRNGVPPILLSSGQTHVARAYNLLPTETTQAPRKSPVVMPVPLDDDHAQHWATALRASMMPAIETRRAEDMRAMVYDVVPQVWTRLRPSFGARVPTQDDGAFSAQSSRQTLDCSLRPASSTDTDWNILMQALYQGENIHIGCGAKFGCDILLYDGPRSERHSFAGLRLVQPGSAKFPLPRAYDLGGFVRCLNTAGKLALLATVTHDDETGHRVSIIDLALEKVDVKRKTKPTKTLEKRMENLSKTKT